LREYIPREGAVNGGMGGVFRQTRKNPVIFLPNSAGMGLTNITNRGILLTLVEKAGSRPIPVGTHMDMRRKA
jgi:hypothetical protein